MKKSILLILLVSFFISINAYSFGAGIIIGNPLGIRLKLNTNKYNSLNTTLAWSYVTNQLYMSFDYHYNFYRIAKGENSNIPFMFYTGPGARFLITNNSNNNKFGIKFTGGIAYKFKEIPLEIFAEIAPILDFYPATQLDLNGGVGFIFYFL